MTFSMENTNGFTAEQLLVLNEALAIRVARGEDEKTASDAVNNAWVEGATLEDLI